MKSLPELHIYLIYEKVCKRQCLPVSFLITSEVNNINSENISEKILFICEARTVEFLASSMSTFFQFVTEKNVTTN